ncbi:DNA polymerase epsilon subunit 2-like [Uloborus diversus]|uniref:DNA polymerase epsilon subunit 2-like n=1 Tax=Uloborus diversus TaxID=327109 RepID=UPI00240A6F8A|nr:DNA polymerase epsilon subunit 2-like [Uloborus diversus]
MNKSNIISAFSIHGFTLRREALNYLQQEIDSLGVDQRKEALQSILDHVNGQNLSSSMLEKSVIESAVKNFYHANDVDEVPLNVFDAFSFVRYTYDLDSKRFIKWDTLHKKPSSLHGSPDSKANIFREIFKVIQQRTIRHHLFAPPAISEGSNQNQAYTLFTVEHVLGSSSKDTNIIVLGMLTQLKEGQFYLEDPTGVVRLNLSKTTYKGGLFTENSIVMVEGNYEDRVFYVSALGFPPAESADVSLSFFQTFHPASSEHSYIHRLSDDLKRSEQIHGDAMFVFLSDVWLDQLKVMQKLQILFAGYSLMPPTVFVLIGNFLSLSGVGSSSKVFEECFSKLGQLISEFPRLVTESQFVIVPGPDDPGVPYVLPRPAIPFSYVGDFKKKVPNAIFASNPCRLQYYSQDILIFREDIISKMCRNSIYTPWEYEEKVDIPSLFVKSVIGNAHLLPLALNVAPRYWEYDYALWLYPLPDVVVCADKYDPYTVTSNNCTFFNPGSLPRSNFAFKVYFPAARQVEDSEISDETLS